MYVIFVKKIDEVFVRPKNDNWSCIALDNQFETGGGMVYCLRQTFEYETSVSF